MVSRESTSWGGEDRIKGRKGCQKKKRVGRGIEEQGVWVYGEQRKHSLGRREQN